jgi:hypothetical protein
VSFDEANDHGNQLIFSAPSTSHRRSWGGRNGDDPGTATHSIVQRRRGVRRGRPDCARRLGSEPDHRVAGTPGWPLCSSACCSFASVCGLPGATTTSWSASQSRCTKRRGAGLSPRVPGVTAVGEMLVTFIGAGQVWVLVRPDIDDDLRGAQGQVTRTRNRDGCGISRNTSTASMSCPSARTPADLRDRDRPGPPPAASARSLLVLLGARGIRLEAWDTFAVTTGGGAAGAR